MINKIFKDKKTMFCLLIILLIIIMTMLYIKKNNNKVVKSYEINSITEIKKNKDKIESVTVSKLTIGSHYCYNVDVKEAYNSISNIRIIEKSNMSVTDDYMSYIFYYNDGSKTSLSFEGPYLADDTGNYTIEFEKINLLDEDLIDCE